MLVCELLGIDIHLNYLHAKTCFPKLLYCCCGCSYTEVPGGICGELSEKFTDPESGASVLKCLGYGIGQRVKELPAC